MLSSSTSFLSFSCRFLILQVLRFTMRDWLALPITTTNEEQRPEPSWFTILNVFSIAKKLKNNAASSSSREIVGDCKDNEDQQEASEYEDDDEIIVTQIVNKDINKEQDEEDSELEEDEESRLPRTFSSSSIATSTDTEHSTHEYYDKTTNIKLYWNHGGNKVQVTGEFDNWSGSVNMVREAENRHVVEIPMDLSKDIEYKFVVDGEWKYAIDLPHRSDFHGNINNVIYKK